MDFSSNLFHVRQPDTFWVFSYLLESVEANRNADYQDDKDNWIPGYWTLDYDTVKKMLAKAWVEAFKQTLKDQALPGKVKYTGHGSPTYYNYYGDWANFDFKISEKGLKLLYERTIEDRQAFAEYLERYYSPRSGFIPYRTKHISEWEGAFHAQDFEWAVSQALDFTMWPTDDDRKKWSADYIESFCDAERFDDAWIFIEEKEKKHG